MVKVAMCVSVFLGGLVLFSGFYNDKRWPLFFDCVLKFLLVSFVVVCSVLGFIFGVLG